MSRWPLVQLGDVLDSTQYGTSKKASDTGLGLPIIRMGNVTYDGALDLTDLKRVELSDAEADGQLLQANDILFNRTNSKELVGKTGLWDGRFPAVAASYFIRLRTKPHLAEPAFVRAVMNSVPMKRRLYETARGAIGQANINTRELRGLEIPLPSIEEQRRIVDLLDRATAVRWLREQALAKARETIPALFLSMFGDPATNSKGWPTARLGELADVQGGLQVSAKRVSLPLELPYLRVANVLRDRLELSEIKTIRLTSSERDRVRLLTGDLLVVEGHGNPEEIGRVAVWDGSIPECVHQNHLIRVRTDQCRLKPEFAAAFLNSETGRAALLRAGKTTSGLNTISTSNVKATPVNVPQFDLQERFVDRLADLRSVITQQARALVLARGLERSLMAGLLG